MCAFAAFCCHCYYGLVRLSSDIIGGVGERLTRRILITLKGRRIIEGFFLLFAEIPTFRGSSTPVFSFAAFVCEDVEVVVSAAAFAGIQYSYGTRSVC